MYPGIAFKNEFEPKKVTPVHFRAFEEPASALTGSMPAANISETPIEYRLQIATPGMSREDFNIELKEGVIFIAARKKPEYSNCINDRCEFDYHDWARAFILPDDADAILTQATYQNGELIIRIPKNHSAETSASVAVFVY